MRGTGRVVIAAIVEAGSFSYLGSNLGERLDYPRAGDIRVSWLRSSLTVDFSRELRNDVLAGDITLSVRLWQRARVKEGGRYRVGPGEIEIDALELVPFAAITREDVRRAGEPDRETLRRRAAHAGPIDEDTLVYRVEFHVL
jgi:hypothetical protein